MKRHVFHPDADHEYAEAAFYDQGISAELGGRFFDEIESLIADIPQPDKKDVEVYREMQTLQDELSQSLRPVFGRHRKFVLQ